MLGGNVAASVTRRLGAGPWWGRERPRQTYVIGTAGRSASSLLAEALTATGRLGRPEEYVHEGNLGHWARTWGVEPPVDGRSASRYLRAIVAHQAGSGQAVGLKLHTGSL